MKPFKLIIFILILSGCSTHTSPRQAPKGEQFMFVTNSEEDIFRAAYDAMSEVRPELPIVDMDGSVRGYRMTLVFALDQYTTFIRVFRAEGEDASGKTVSGYYPEVSGNGTMIIQGPANDKAVYDLVLNKFNSIGRKTKVSELRRVNYSMERDRWRLHSKPSLRDGGSIKLELPSSIRTNKKSVPERLIELESLKNSGAVSEEEYKSLRSNILKDL
jgi:hypothetical protein